MSFGEYLKSLREGKNMTLNQLAMYANISAAQLSRIENGKRGVPKPTTIKKIADGLKVPYEDLMEKAGYLDEYNEQKQKDDIKPNLRLFSNRLKQGMHQKSITLEQAVEECGVKPEYIEKLMNNPDKLPSAGTLYKLAELLDVTPDYLGGFTDDPDGRSPHTPKPKDLVNFLKQEDVMFHGVPLNEEDKQKIENVLIGLFWESKQMNKRKKK